MYLFNALIFIFQKCKTFYFFSYIIYINKTSKINLKQKKKGDTIIFLYNKLKKNIEISIIK